jgi:hypothetical protein
MSDKSKNTHACFDVVSGFWDPDKNEGKTLDDYAPSSRWFAYWRCPMGHTWRSTVSSVFADPICPSCKDSEGVKYYNLATNYPDYASEWHPNNHPLTPEKVFPDSPLKVWWKCSAGHEWEASIRNRIKTKHRCVTCRRNGAEALERQARGLLEEVKKRIRYRMSALSETEFLVHCGKWVTPKS